jgi:hypothetical protein
MERKWIQPVETFRVLHKHTPLSWRRSGYTRSRGTSVDIPDLVERSVLSLLLHGRGVYLWSTHLRPYLKVIRSQRDRAKRLYLLRIQFGRHTHTLKEFLCDGEPQFLQDKMSVRVRHGMPSNKADHPFKFIGNLKPATEGLKAPRERGVFVKHTERLHRGPKEPIGRGKHLNHPRISLCNRNGLA